MARDWYDQGVESMEDHWPDSELARLRAETEETLGLVLAESEAVPQDSP